jgi:hypothetical protein
LPFGNEIAVEPLVVRLQCGDMLAKHIHKFRVWGFAGLFAQLFSGRTHNICGDQHPCFAVIARLPSPAATHGPRAHRRCRHVQPLSSLFVCEPFRRRIVHERAPIHSAARTVRANG